MESAKTIQDLRNKFKATKSRVADDTVFSATALMWLCEQMASGALSPRRKKLSPTKWQKAVSKGMREGKSIQQIAQEWRNRHA